MRVTLTPIRKLIRFFNESGYRVLLENGDGTFGAAGDRQRWGNAATATGPLLSGDFDGDGKLDFAYGDGVYFGNGDATFRRVGIGGGTAVAVGDLNGDRLADIVLRTGEGQLSVAMYRGGGAFGAPTVFASPFDLNYPILVADFTGDGVGDLAGKSATSWDFLVLPGSRSGALGTPLRSSFAAGEPVRPPASAIFATADFNRDGRAICCLAPVSFRCAGMARLDFRFC